MIISATAYSTTVNIIIVRRANIFTEGEELPKVFSFNYMPVATRKNIVAGTTSHVVPLVSNATPVSTRFSTTTNMLSCRAVLS